MAEPPKKVVPRKPAFDAKTFSGRLHENVKSATGSQYAVFDPTNDSGGLIGFPRWKGWVDDLRDHLEALRVGVFGTDGIKNNMDQHSAKLANHEARIKRIEEAPSGSPFPFEG